MKKIAIILACLATLPVMADDYWNEYDYEQTALRRDTYVGFRIHKNEKIAFKYNENHGGNSTVRRDNWGLGAVIGNRLTDYVKIEFETLYTGAEQTKRTRDFNYDIWANMFNVYLFREFGNAVAPYAGLGLGFAAIWGDIDSPVGNMSDSVFDLSFQAMVGVNFALNDRIDLNLGLKYQYYGEVEHKLHNRDYATTDVDATELYFGAVYKFGLK